MRCSKTTNGGKIIDLRIARAWKLFIWYIEGMEYLFIYPPRKYIHIILTGINPGTKNTRCANGWLGKER